MNKDNINLTDEILEDILFSNIDINGFGKKTIKFNISDPNYGTRTFRFRGFKKDNSEKIILEPIIEGFSCIENERSADISLKTQSLSMINDFLKTERWKNHIAIDI
tara:strand:+ start:862 stop:1179 length:318 start_codon:yes stop_codon:yes gene_type:complete